MTEVKDRSESVETFSDELKGMINEGLPPVEDDALVKRARELTKGLTHAANLSRRG